MGRRERMVFPMVLFRMVSHWLLSCYRAAKKIRGHAFLLGNSCRPHHISSLYPSVTKCRPLKGGAQTLTLVCDIQGALLRSPSSFPFFMLVAFEGGSPLRALLLLLSFPLVWLLGNQQHELGLRIMVLITFCGLRKRDMDTVARAVLPKFYLESLNLHSYDVLASTGKRVVLTSLPRVMVEGFLREYLAVSDVVGTELQVVGGCYYTGFASQVASMAVKHKAIKDLFGDSKPDVGLVSSWNPNPHDHLLISHCKEIFVVSKEQSRGSGAVMPREKKYPKPLVFHDSRLAFLPTPLATLSLFLWLPLGLTLAVIRALIGILLPYKAAIIVWALTGFHLRVQGLGNINTTNNSNIKSARSGGNRGVLYACNHRTLLDPVIVSTALGKPATAVTYSLSKMSELIAPMKTVRLTRNRERDAETMRRLLADGDLIVCPEGTTCREPYLLRFSSLFAELADDIVPVAVDTKVSMFHGTTASGLKWLDPVFFLMNPWPEYRVEFLGRMPPELTCAGRCSGWDVANGVQRRLGDALGFGCTALTRKDKYLMLAGNDGVV